jgi:hypothetical protein
MKWFRCPAPPPYIKTPCQVPRKSVIPECQSSAQSVPCLFSFPNSKLTSYKYATRSPERAASPATYLLISKAFIAPEVVFGVGKGVDVGVAIAVAALDEEGDVEAVMSLLEVLEAVIVVVAVRLDALVDEEMTTVLLLDGFELLFDGFEDVY